MPWNCHQEVLHILSWITYCLNTARCNTIIMKRSSTWPAESLTCWTQPDATKSAPRGFAYVKLNHQLSGHSQMPQNHHQQVLHMFSWITYSLNTVRCHKITTKRLCTCQAESHTVWTKPDATKSSPRRSAHVKSNHLLAEHRQMPQNHH